MAHFGTPFAGPENLGATPLQNPFATPFAKVVEEEDPDEWEYEYSTTETETYYVTLDLTTPAVDPKRKPPPSDGRIRTKWINPNLGRNRRMRSVKPATYSTVMGRSKEAEAEEDAVGDAEVEDEELEDDAPATKGASSQEKESEQPSEIQILDFHGSNPLVSYDGHTYSCQWASNIGTELLFKAHDRDNAMPVIRTLPGGVDLIAATSARLISNYVELEPKQRESSPERTYIRGSQLPYGDQAISVGKFAGAKRRDQASFLERLIDIKQKKGEKDAVTVNATKRLTTRSWKLKVDEKRANERKSLESLIKRKGRAAPSKEEVEDAKQRLQELDEEDKKLAAAAPLAERKTPAKSSANSGAPKRKAAEEGQSDKVYKKRKRRRRIEADAQWDGADEEAVGGEDQDDEDKETPLGSSAVSPRHGVQPGQMNDGLADEDAPGEDDDTHLQINQ